MPERLRLIAADGADLETISALMQDAAIKASDIAYDPVAGRIVLLGNRYRWEADGRTRVRTALRIDAVTSARRRAWPPPETVLDLLAIRHVDAAIEIDFAGGAAIRIEVEAIDVELHDLAGPWGAKRTPQHAV
jgi:hypothetical protein